MATTAGSISEYFENKGEARAEARAEAKWEAKGKVLEARGKILGKIENLTSLLEDGSISQEVYQARVKPLEERLTALEADMQETA